MVSSRSDRKPESVQLQCNPRFKLRSYSSMEVKTGLGNQCSPIAVRLTAAHTLTWAVVRQNSHDRTGALPQPSVWQVTSGSLLLALFRSLATVRQSNPEYALPVPSIFWM